MSTLSATAFTSLKRSTDAGRDLGTKLCDKLGTPPQVIIVFASSRFAYDELLGALSEACGAAIIIGSSSAGEFVDGADGQGSACAMALSSTDMIFGSGLGQAVSQDPSKAAAEVITTFHGDKDDKYPYRTALVMTDVLAGHGDDLVEQLVIATGGRYQFAGGGAGDDARFDQTHVFYGGKAHSDAVVVLEMLSSRPIGIGVGHGWIPASDGLRITESDGARIISINGLPAVDAFADHAATTGQRLAQDDPLPFFLHNIIGIESGADVRLRVPLALHEDGSITCAAQIPTGAKVFIMKTNGETAVQAAATATATAVRGLHGEQPGAALFFDCVASRLRMGSDFGIELDAVTNTLAGANMVGCNTYGQIARAVGQFSGFHNCTAVVLVMPK